MSAATQTGDAQSLPLNARLGLLQPYPFERLRALTASIRPAAHLRPIGLGIGEPRHPTPQFIKDALAGALDGLAHYPATAGEPRLRDAIADWLRRRYGVGVDPQTQILPVAGSREALFAVAQTVVDGTGSPQALVVCPNPFYQIYEGAALLAGAQTWFVASDAARGYAGDWQAVPASVWSRTRLVYVCSPDNPTGRVLRLDEWRQLFDLSERHGFVIVADECYSEIYLGDEPPLGALQAAAALGRSGFPRLLTVTSLSKRSNVPGLRSGFVAGDARLIAAFLKYRTYHGCALGPAVQAASLAAWSDEAHVADNRRLYREKFDALVPMLAPVLPCSRPEAGFYLWAEVPRRFDGDDLRFSLELLEKYNVAVLPGSLLARDQPDGSNPGRGRVRLALVAMPQDCIEAARRIVAFASPSA
jgi:N-succinyldiaminopimelate aminotransferase